MLISCRHTPYPNLYPDQSPSEEWTMEERFRPLTFHGLILRSQLVNLLIRGVCYSENQSVSLQSWNTTLITRTTDFFKSGKKCFFFVLFFLKLTAEKWILVPYTNNKTKTVQRPTCAIMLVNRLLLPSLSECHSAQVVLCRDDWGLSSLPWHPWSGPHPAQPSHDCGMPLLLEQRKKLYLYFSVHFLSKHIMSMSIICSTRMLLHIWTRVPTSCRPTPVFLKSSTCSGPWD